jgi:uncharacterized protein (TIRG00374 family)
MTDSSVVPELSEREPRPVTLHLLRIIPAVVVLGLLLHFVLPRLGSVEESIDALNTMKPWALVLAILFETLCYVANGELLQSVVHLTGERMSLRRAAAIEMGAGTVSLVAAGALGFGAAIYRWTRDSGVSRDAAMLASWLPPVFDSITLVLFALVGAVELLLVHQLSRTTEIALAVVIAGLALAVATIIVLLVRNDWMTAIALRITKLIKRVRPAADDTLLMDAADRAAKAWSTMRSGGWVLPTCSSLLVMTFDFLCLRYAFLAAGQHLYITTLLAGYGVPLLLGRSSFLPGGIAVTEVAMAAIFGGLGVPPGAAIVGVLTYRLISFWLPALIGIPIAITLQSRGVSRSTVGA